VLIIFFQTFVIRRLTRLVRELQYRIDTGNEMPAEADDLAPDADVARKQDDLFTRIYKALTRSNRAGKEKDIMLDHNYDGIRELDNIMPPWLQIILYGTIIFAVVYWMVYHVYDLGKLPKEEYVAELQQAQLMKEARLKLVGASVDENTVMQLTDAATLSSGKSIFISRCAACHGQLGEGGVGPNLTDDYWLHGGTVNDIFKTVKYGVPAKGMVPWQGVLKPEEMQTVASFVMSLHGSNPPNAKDPQGVLVAPQAAASDTTQIKTDSTQMKTI
jgi:cytochrome c oxidase cbb3-type subunit 3